MSLSCSLRKSPGSFLRLAVALFAVSAVVPTALAQSDAAQQELPAAPGPSAAAPQKLTFPPPNPANFTADKPTVAEVDTFLKTTWGYNAELVWQVEAIAKTPVAGISKVTVDIGQKSNPSQVGQLVFFVLPDGQHIISQDDMVPFGAHPFASNRRILETGATGPARGPASKDLLIVEFADFQCPHCKEAQPNITRLVQDFPNARFVFESFPLPMHSEAPKAAAYGVCVQKAAGDAVFFQYADAVFTNQAGLTPEASAATLTDIVKKLGLDPERIEECSTSAVGLSGVKTSVDLAHELDVRETPWLYVNGRGVPVGGMPYEQLKAIISYQIALDGLAATTAAK
jgi:protein-disulfide isomerase